MNEVVINWLMQECNVTEEVARVTLEHAKHNVFQAKELLQSEMFKAKMYREVREYNSI